MKQYNPPTEELATEAMTFHPEWSSTQVSKYVCKKQNRKFKSVLSGTLLKKIKQSLSNHSDEQGFKKLQTLDSQDARNKLNDLLLTDKKTTYPDFVNTCGNILSRVKFQKMKDYFKRFGHVPALKSRHKQLTDISGLSVKNQRGKKNTLFKILHVIEGGVSTETKNCLSSFVSVLNNLGRVHLEIVERINPSMIEIRESTRN